MHAYPSKIRYPSDKQLEIWKLRRDKLKGREIADKKDITEAAVSKSLKEANKRIKDLIEYSARMNKIELERTSAKLGFAWGKSHTFKLKAWITFSPVNGVHVWYKHEGACEACGELGYCRSVLKQEFKERNLKLPSEMMKPSKLAELLFQILEAMVE